MSNQSKTKNSSLRQASKGPIAKTVEFMGERAPGVKADHITVAGLIGSLAASFLWLKYPHKKKTATALHGVSSFADSFDGPWDEWERTVKGKKPTKHGPILDVVADKLQEVTTFVTQGIYSWRKGKKATGAAYLISAATSPMPALMRARAESRGNIVKEGGLGTRPARAVVGAAGIAFGDRPGASTVLGAFSATQNTVTAFQRYQAGDSDSVHSIGRIEDPAQIEAAGSRYKALQLVTAAAVATSAAVGAHLVRRGPGHS